jgi:predicted MFS family arabinose efflux permease
VLAAGICALILTVGIARFAYTPFLPVMLEQTSLNELNGGWLATFNYSGYLFGVVLISLISSLRLKYLFYRINLVIAVFSTIMMGLSTDLVVWSISRFIGGMSSTAGIILAAGFVMSWLKQRGYKGQLGLHFSGLGLGIVIPGLAIIALGHFSDWAMQWILIGVFGLIFFIPAWLWMPAPITQTSTTTVQQAPPSRQWMSLMIAAYFCAGVGYVVSATFIVAILEAMPALSGKGNWIWVCLGLMAVPSCLLWDRLANRIGETRALILSYSIMLLAIITPALSDHLLINTLGAVLFGGTFAGVVSMMLVFIGHQFPVNPAKAMAKLTISYGIAQIAAPAIAGYIATHGGSYAEALWLAAGCMFIGIVCLWRIHRITEATIK